MAASLSRGVFCKFTITRFFLFLATVSGMLAAGVTRKLDPSTRHKSAYFDSANPFFSARSGKFSPKFTIVSSKSPLQFGFSHNLPVMWSLTKIACLVQKSLKYFLLHLLQISRF